MDVITWSQFGVAGLIATALGGVVAYIFKLLIKTQDATIQRLVAERDSTMQDNAKLHGNIEDQQRVTLSTLADVARVMGEVQNMLREREVQQQLDRELERRRQA